MKRNAPLTITRRRTMLLSDVWRRLALVACATASVVVLAACSSGDGGTLNGANAVEKRASVKTSTSTVPAANIRMHFHRAAGVYTGYGVSSWDGPQVPDVTWIVDRFLFTNTDSFGGYVDIPINTSKSEIWFLVTDASGNKNCQNDQGEPFASDIATAGQEIWMLENDCTIYSSPPALTYG